MSYASICSAVQNECLRNHPNDAAGQSDCGLSFTVCSISASADYAASTILAAVTAATTPGPVTVTVTPTADPTTSSSTPTSAVSKDLSTGAKAGIGVGVGVAALIVALVVAVVLIRRRRTQNARQSYGYGTGSALNNEKSHVAFAQTAEKRNAK